MHGSLAPDLLPAHDRQAAVTVRPVSILLVDGRPLVRECLARGIGAEWPEARIAATGWDGLASVARGDVALCLVSLAAGGSLDKIRAVLPEAGIVVLGDDDGYAQVARAAAQGARGYFSTSVDLARSGPRHAAGADGRHSDAPRRHPSRPGYDAIDPGLTLLGRAVHAQGARGAAERWRRVA